MHGHGRIHHSALARKVVPADAAAAMIEPGATVGMSGFTGAGYPKEVPLALAQRITEANTSGAHFKVNVWTGASTAPELGTAPTSVDSSGGGGQAAVAARLSVSYSTGVSRPRRL